MPKMSEALIKAQRKYDKETARRFLLKFNKNTDADVIAKLESVDSIQGYIRELIRKDLSCRE